MNDESLAKFEQWLREEFRTNSVISGSQQALRREFGFEDDVASAFAAKSEADADTFYSVRVEPYTLDAQPELTFTKV